MKDDSWRLLKDDGGRGIENEPVGTLKEPVNEPVGLECDSWLNEGKVKVPDGEPEKLPVGCGKEPVNDGAEKEDSARLLMEPVKVGGGTLLWETDE